MRRRQSQCGVTERHGGVYAILRIKDRCGSNNRRKLHDFAMAAILWVCVRFGFIVVPAFTTTTVAYPYLLFDGYECGQVNRHYCGLPWSQNGTISGPALSLPRDFTGTKPAVGTNKPALNRVQYGICDLKSQFIGK